MAADPIRGALPGPWRITFDTNPDDCNLACLMCEEHSDFSEKKTLRIAGHRPHRRMDVAVIRRVISEMVPRGLREVIPSTMGEPLLYEHFDEILALCREHGVRLNLTTNGTWPNRGPARWGELLCPVTTDVKISWNGTTPHTQETIMKGSSLAKRTEDLRAFLRIRDLVHSAGGERCRVTLQCTFLQSNVDELPSLVRFAADLGADRVKGHHLWVHFGQMAEQDLRRTPQTRRHWNETVRGCTDAAERYRRPDGTRIQLDNFLTLPEIAAELPSEWVCPFLGREAWVNHAGRFDPCCAPDLERQSLGSFGFVTVDGGLQRVWDGPAYRTLVRDYKGTSVCRKCTLRRPAQLGI
jgi:MoaA/NifB/PqqE/SkfB family radical SAM enzyme